MSPAASPIFPEGGTEAGVPVPSSTGAFLPMPPPPSEDRPESALRKKNNKKTKNKNHTGHGGNWVFKEDSCTPYVTLQNLCQAEGWAWRSDYRQRTRLEEDGSLA